MDIIRREGVYSPKTLSRSTGVSQEKIEDILLILEKNGFLKITETNTCQNCDAKGFCSPKDKLKCIKTQTVELEIR